MGGPQAVAVAVWGVGEHARRNALPALARCADVRLVGLTTRDRVVGRAEAERWDCRRWRSPEEMLRDDEVEAVYVATPNALHHPHGSAVLQHDKHLWCEKPMTDRLTRTVELCREAEERDLMVAEVFMYLHHPQFIRVRQRLAEGVVGRVRSFTARFGFPHLSPDNVRYDAQLGGGALLDIGVYPVSACLALLGAEPARVHATLEWEEGYEVDTGGAALFTYRSGESAQLAWGFGRAYRNEIEVWGEEGTLVAERAFSKPADFAPRVRIHLQDGKEEEERIEASDHFELMFSAFADGVRTRERREGFRLRVMEQARLVQIILDDASGGS